MGAYGRSNGQDQYEREDCQEHQGGSDSKFVWKTSVFYDLIADVADEYCE